MIHRKKNDLLYKDITCLCHSLAWLWVLCLVVLFLLGLGFAPLSVVGFSSVLFYAFVHQAVVFVGSLLFSTWRGCCFCWMLLFRLFLRPSSFWFYCCRHIVGLLRIVSVLGFSWGTEGSIQVLFIVVPFILIFSMVPLFVPIASFSVLFHIFFCPALLLNGFVLFHILYGYFLLTVLFRV